MRAQERNNSQGNCSVRWKMKGSLSSSPADLYAAQLVVHFNEITSSAAKMYQQFVLTECKKDRHICIIRTEAEVLCLDSQ